jgi:HD superfamily phosphodiesterase
LNLSPAFPERIINARQRESFREILTDPRLRPLYTFIVAIHERNTENGWTSQGHSLDHDLAVTAFAHAIAFARGGDANNCLVVMAAGLMHSYDRYRRSEESEVSFDETDVRTWVERFLVDFPESDRHSIVEAVLRHDRPNKGKITEDPTVGDVLADADKLANLMFYTLIRSGQYEPGKPTVILGSLSGMSQGSNYKFHRSALDDVFGMLEWVDDMSWFVTDEATEVAGVLEEPLRYFIDLNQRQFAALGIDELP